MLIKISVSIIFSALVWGTVQTSAASSEVLLSDEFQKDCFTKVMNNKDNLLESLGSSSTYLSQGAYDYACVSLLGAQYRWNWISNLTEQRTLIEVARESVGEIQRQDSDWYEYLPDCPLMERTAGDNPTEWARDSFFYDFFSVSGCYHIGASDCYRTRKGYQSSSNSPFHGQQCCYDDSGFLIRRGTGAGTPDFISSEVSEHARLDVMPFLVLPLSEYHSVWPPNQGGVEMPLGQLTDTELDLVENQGYEIVAHGIVRWGHVGSRSDPNGSRNVADSPLGYLLAPPPAPEFPTGSLVGIILAPNGEASQLFFVGSHLEFTASMDGRLYLFINDGFIDNNEGAFFVSLRKAI